MSYRQLVRHNIIPRFVAPTLLCGRLETDLISDGTVRIDDKPIQRTDYVTTLPTIEPGQQIEIVLQGKDGPIRAFLRPKEVAAKAGAAHDRLAWGAVIPLEPPR